MEQGQHVGDDDSTLESSVEVQYPKLTTQMKDDYLKAMFAPVEDENQWW